MHVYVYVCMQCFFPRDIFFGARDIFGKNARDIQKMPVTNLGKNARDIPDFKSSKIPHYDDFFFYARDIFARDIEKMPVTILRKMPVTSKKGP